MLTAAAILYIYSIYSILILNRTIRLSFIRPAKFIIFSFFLQFFRVAHRRLKREKLQVFIQQCSAWCAGMRACACTALRQHVCIRSSLAGIQAEKCPCAVCFGTTKIIIMNKNGIFFSLYSSAPSFCVCFMVVLQ